MDNDAAATRDLARTDGSGSPDRAAEKDGPLARDQLTPTDFFWRPDPHPHPDKTWLDLPAPPPDKALTPPDKNLVPEDKAEPKPDKGFIGCMPCVATWQGCQIKCYYPAGNSTLGCVKTSKNINCKITGAKCGKVTGCAGYSAIGATGCQACNKARYVGLCSSLIQKGGC